MAVRETVGTASADKAIRLGHPSYVWRRGQDRRLNLIRQHVPLEGRRILDVGCGLGMYVRQLRRFSDEVYGVDVDPDKIAAASETLPNLRVAPAEALPFPDEFFDVILLHEVIEHVDDDRQTIREAYRCLRPGGRMIIFAPNRLYFFETHGFYLGNRYIFRLLPLVNYTPDFIRNRFAPHVRIYTARGLRRLFRGLAVDFEVCTHVFPGFDNIVARHPRLGRAIVRARDLIERTPLRCFGISHFMVVRKRARAPRR
ncbi:MAG: class I SAM-dependent methyltransferase [Chloroflexi bacterium]|nr:class I SAM-dependent methyltransferase [Chloroflexota bacterium]